MEGDGGGIDNLLEQFLEERGFNAYAVVCDKLLHPVEQCVHTVECLGGEVVVRCGGRLWVVRLLGRGNSEGYRLYQPQEACSHLFDAALVCQGREELGEVLVGRKLRQCGVVDALCIEGVAELFRFGGDELGVRMAQYGVDGVQRVVSAALHQGQSNHDQRRDGRLVERIAGGDVDVLHGRRQTVQHRREQRLVSHHDGSSSACSNALRGEPLGDVACLYVLR